MCCSNVVYRALQGAEDSPSVSSKENPGRIWAHFDFIFSYVSNRTSICDLIAPLWQ